MEDNLALLEDLKSRRITVPVLLRAEIVEDAEVLYKKGADFVIIPEILAGDFLKEKLSEHFQNKAYFKHRKMIEQQKLRYKTLAWD